MARYNDIDLTGGITHIMADPAWQYDVGLTLRITGADIPNGTMWHFSNRRGGAEAYARACTTSGGVTTIVVPDACFVNDNRIIDFVVYCYAVVSATNQAVVRYEVDIPVNARSGQAKQYSEDPYLTAFDRIASQVSADAQNVGDALAVKNLAIYASQQVELKANSANVYTKYETDARIAEAKPKDYETVKADVQTLKTDKADKDDTYTKNEVNSLIGGVNAKITNIQLAGLFVEDGVLYYGNPDGGIV